jgi:hypothetical protein
MLGTLQIFFVLVVVLFFERFLPVLRLVILIVVLFFARLLPVLRLPILVVVGVSG